MRNNTPVRSLASRLTYEEEQVIRGLVVGLGLGPTSLVKTPHALIAAVTVASIDALAARLLRPDAHRALFR